MSATETGIRKDLMGLARGAINDAATKQVGQGSITKPVILTTSTGKPVTNPADLTGRALTRSVVAAYQKS